MLITTQALFILVNSPNHNNKTLTKEIAFISFRWDTLLQGQTGQIW